MNFYIYTGRNHIKKFDSIIKARSAAIADIEENNQYTKKIERTIYSTLGTRDHGAVEVGTVYKDWDHYEKDVYCYKTAVNNTNWMKNRPVYRCFKNGRLGEKM